MRIRNFPSSKKKNEKMILALEYLKFSDQLINDQHSKYQTSMSICMKVGFQSYAKELAFGLNLEGVVGGREIGRRGRECGMQGRDGLESEQR